MSWMLSCIGCGGKKLIEKEEAKVLDFQHYSLTYVPPYVFECERFLEELYLDFNQIAELPRELFLCNELQILSLSDNDLHNLPPAISSLSNLTSLDLSKNGISDIPDSIKSCKRLRSVNASTNPLCRLPEGFTQLVALRELALSDTFLEYLPANFGRLIGLEVLELRENQLNTLPRSMTRLTSLKRLDLGQNEFTELPEVVGHLTNLTDLWIDNNRVKRIPTEIGKLSHLSFFDASKNRINEIDSSIGNCKSLSHLYLTRNELEEIPDFLCQCAKISILHVDDNHLDHLPDDIGCLDRLVEMKVSQNELSSLPSSVGLLRSLQFLHVDDNMLCSLPGELGSCVSLIVVTAAHNHITEMPAEVGSLAGLRVLNLCGNSIQNLPVSFSKLQLTALWLSENQAKPSVPLQCTNDSGQKVLTCFMLPQSVTQSSPVPDRIEDERPLTQAEIDAKRARSIIHFASDGDLKPSGRLSRVPTPYPKELRALAKHTRNILALKKEKEKGTAAAAEENKESVMKDAEEVCLPKENTNSVSTIKSAAAVKVASNMASDSAIKHSSPCKDEPSSERIVTTVSVEDIKAVISVSDSPSPVCQNGFSPVSISSPDHSQVTNCSKPTEERKDIVIEALQPFNETSFVQSKSVNYPLVAPVYVPSSFSQNVPPTSIGTMKDTFKDSQTQPITSHRPASIAVVDLGSTAANTRSNYPLRPGSLALENILPPWQNQRPGSLAAPINIIGIPMANHSQKSASQNALYGGNLKTPTFGESWKPYQSPTITPGKADLSSKIVNENREEIIREHSNGEIINEKFSSEIPLTDATDATSHSLNINAVNESRLSFTLQDKEEQVESSFNTGLVSTINRVTEEGSDEETNSTPEKTVTSKIPRKPTILSSTLSEPPEQNYNNYRPSGIQAPSKLIVSPGGNAASKIPYISSSSKIAQITSPKITSPDSTSTKDSSVSHIATSKIQPPTYSSSKLNPEKSKSNIPSIPSPAAKKEFEFESKSQEGKSTTKIPQKHEYPSRTPPREISVTNKEVLSSKSSSRIPTFASPTEPKELSTPNFVRSPSQTDRESFIPVKRSDSNPKVKQILSPVEKPINQTGIPILSPNEASRIPASSGSSLRGKKSGVPVPADKSLKYYGGRRYADSSS